jgi:sugar phosphate isomerase/epimerase
MKPTFAMKISILTDEISSDPETAIELGTQWGIHDFELRGYYTDRAPSLSTYQKLRLREVLERYDARVIAIGSGLFKVPLPTKHPDEFPMPWLDQAMYKQWSDTQKQVNEHINELLPESLDYANELGAQLVVIFAFDRAGLPPGPPPEELLSLLSKAAERAKVAGLRLAIENEAGFWADTGARTAKIVQMINHPCLGVNWDPANAFCEGDVPYPDGYACVRNLVQHVHFKDARHSDSGTVEFTGEGQVDWAGQIMALKADGYSGHISIETHLRPKVAEARAALNRLQSLIGAAESLS